MGIRVCCMTWAPILWHQILRLFTKTIVVDLPDEIIINILSRLPAELVFQCRQSGGTLKVLTSSQTFIDLHLNRAATTVIVFQRDVLVWRLPNNTCNCTGELPLYFLDDRSKKLVRRSMQIDYSSCSFLRLIYSYRGLLLFHNFRIFIMWNPITEEQVIVNVPDSSCPCGFFFDPKTRGYKVLFMHRVGSRFQFEIYSLRTRSSEKSIKFSHPPWFRQAVNLNNVLHWRVDEKRYEQANGSSLKSSDSIVLFDMDTQNVSTMARPGGQYDKRLQNDYVHLLKMGELLCYCDAASCVNLNVWILEDYTDMVWIKKLTINLGFLGCGGHSIRGLKIDDQDEDLLLEHHYAIYRYSLKSNKVRKFEMHDEQGRGYLWSFALHTNTLASLGAM